MNSAAQGRHRPPSILFVEDELWLIEEFPKTLMRDGYSVLTTSRPADALKIIREQEYIDLAILDIQLPTDVSPEIGSYESGGGRFTGFVLARELRKKFRHVPIIFWSGAYGRDIQAMLRSLGNARLVPKAAGHKPVLDLVQENLEGLRTGSRPKSLIVHGHDERTMLAFRSFLQNRLHFPPPVVLREEASYGQTLIEKIESYAYSVDLVFVLLTPDDRVLEDASQKETSRARQNVIFELGYFLGILGRTSGKVILLYRQPIELPSDLAGMIAIDITPGIEASSAEDIVQAVREWL